MSKNFITPSIVLLSIILFVFFTFVMPQPSIATILLLCGITIGSWKLAVETIQSLRKKSFALDYIAILAISVGVITHNYIVAAVIVLMMSGGNALEEYAQQRAKKSLTALKNRLPNQAQVIEKNGTNASVAIEKIPIGSLLLLRKGEVVPLDGTLEDTSALFDESSLTGEAYPVEKHQGDTVRSGTLNIGDAAKIKTTTISADSTYSRIIALVKEAENAKTPFIQLADQLSMVFTLLTLLLSGIAYYLSGGDLGRVLAVLVIATPCPLILATPIALIGGMNAAAQQRIIFKRLSTLEILSRVKKIVLDKTGTLTLGIPTIETIEVLNKKYGEKDVLGLASGLERNSLHPYARAIIVEAQKRKVAQRVFDRVQEKVGIGIQGTCDDQIFLLAADKNHPNSQVVLTENSKQVAVFTFKDELKKTSASVVKELIHLGLEISIFTGDSQERGQELLTQLPTGILLEANLSPEDKRKKLAALKKNHGVVAMVGDGINDAPALALADVGIAFSHQEHTAASEAADVVLLGGSFSSVLEAIEISHHTMFIAKQSMYVGVGLSLVGMMFAVNGHITPIFGAVGQEIIDVAVILNALRATKIKKFS